jgi:uncharacterized Zn finger protein
MDGAPEEVEVGGRATLPRVFAATLFCEMCDRPTPHRILRMDPVRRTGSDRVQGTARCRVCQWTHRFESRQPRRVEVARIVSQGGTSVRSRVEVPAGVHVQVGSGIPGSEEPFRVVRVDTKEGHRVHSARTDDVATLWVVRDVGAVIPVSIVEGRFTRTARIVVPREVEFEVGDRSTVDGTPLRIVALRARGRTWRQPGDRFRALEISRLYGRRTDMPPAGRSDWSRGRAIPSSRTSSASRSERSRSAPGVSRTRMLPRRRSASGGAEVHRVSPS